MTAAYLRRWKASILDKERHSGRDLPLRRRFNRALRHHPLKTGSPSMDYCTRRSVRHNGKCSKRENCRKVAGFCVAPCARTQLKHHRKPMLTTQQQCTQRQECTWHQPEGICYSIYDDDSDEG